MRRRVGFAAPLVIVLGCRRPITEPLDEPVVVPHDAQLVLADAARAIEPAADVPVDAPVDAPVVVDEPRRPRRFTGCGPDGNATCNPPAPTPEYCDAHPTYGPCPKPTVAYCREHPTSPRCPCAPPTICNPPGNIVAHVLQVSVVGDGTVIIVGAGSSRGVTMAMQGHLVGDGERVAPIEMTLETISERTSRWRVAATPDQVKAAGFRVRIQPK